ncbi:hypothetical protein H310_06600 [Aphanomyces invadans]|uniref:VPS9 domain-containing protein n=1 Tax=Aphanomyces invadans TaxID=157072 RepID=A0A024U504_9STRA|nr:hypothetical protein H310_06600 [Aphanomyces invadans]ETW00952.1 hypothetical protein H310_06600 [Aphanomyces invadans]|eukprot:XP_008869950.1 hypothetical protein H310_06600 [Aphanomyces invadans]
MGSLRGADTPPSFDLDYLDLEEELMGSPQDAAASSYLSTFPRCRASSTPTTRGSNKFKPKESLRAFQALRDEDDHATLHREATVTRSTRVARIVEAASSRQSHRRPRGLSSTEATIRSRSVFADLFIDLPPVEKQALAQFVDDEFTRVITQPMGCPASVIADHFRAIFRTAATTSSLTRPIKHSLGNVVLDFATVFHSLYEQHVHCPMQEAIASCAADDVIEFSALLVQVLRFKYPSLASASLLVYVQQAVEDAMFVHLQPTLHGLFTAQCSSADISLATIMAALRHSPCVAESIGVPPLYRLDASSLRHATPYTNCITKMSELPHQRSPSAKVAVVSQVCRLIDVTIHTYYAGHPNPPPVEQLHIAADALVSVLAYVVVMANCPHLASHLALMDAFLPDRISIGEEAYAVTILHTAIAHIRATGNGFA